MKAIKDMLSIIALAICGPTIAICIAVQLLVLLIISAITLPIWMPAMIICAIALKHIDRTII